MPYTGHDAEDAQEVARLADSALAFAGQLRVKELAFRRMTEAVELLLHASFPGILRAYLARKLLREAMESLPAHRRLTQTEIPTSTMQAFEQVRDELREATVAALRSEERSNEMLVVIEAEIDRRAAVASSESTALAYLGATIKSHPAISHAITAFSVGALMALVDYIRGGI